MWWEGRRWLMQDFSRSWTKGGWKIFKFNSSFMRIRHSWSNLNIWRFNGKRPIKKVTEFAHFLVKHENTKNTEVCGLSDFSRMHCELLLRHDSFIKHGKICRLIFFNSETMNFIHKIYIAHIFLSEIEIKVLFRWLKIQCSNFCYGFFSSNCLYSMNELWYK